MHRIIYFLLIPFALYSQQGRDTALDRAYLNAKKGIYWMMENIPKDKIRLDNDLISDDKLIASAKLTKEVNGVRIESTGYFETFEVQVKMYKSLDNLRREGYIRPDTTVLKKDSLTVKESTKRKPKKKF